MTSGYLHRVLTDAEGADVHPGDRVVVKYQRGYAEGVYIGVVDERNIGRTGDFQQFIEGKFFTVRDIAMQRTELNP